MFPQVRIIRLKVNGLTGFHSAHTGGWLHLPSLQIRIRSYKVKRLQSELPFPFCFLWLSLFIYLLLKTVPDETVTFLSLQWGEMQCGHLQSLVWTQSGRVVSGGSGALRDPGPRVPEAGPPAARWLVAARGNGLPRGRWWRASPLSLCALRHLHPALLFPPQGFVHYSRCTGTKGHSGVSPPGHPSKVKEPKSPTLLSQG